MSNIFKDNDIIVENYCFILDCIKKNEESYSNIKSMPYDEALGKKEDILYQAKLKAQQLIQNAVACANDILIDGNKKAREVFELAKKTGYEDGLRQGKAEAEASIKKGYNELRQLIDTIEGKREEIFCDYEDELKELILVIAKKVIDKNLEKDDSLFLNIFKSAVKDYKKLEWVKVSVSEYESELAMTNVDAFLELAKGATDISITVLEDAPRGTCIVETPQNIIDVSVRKQLQKLKETLINAEITA